MAPRNAQRGAARRSRRWKKYLRALRVAAIMSASAATRYANVVASRIACHAKVTSMGDKTLGRREASASLEGRRLFIVLIAARWRARVQEIDRARRLHD